MTVAIDCRGKLCPLPVIELARRISDVAVNEHIELAADDPAAAGDVTAWCRLRGHAYVGASVAPDGVAIYRVRRVV